MAVLRQQRGQPKDVLADGLIRDALAQQTDAPNLLVQRSLDNRNNKVLTA